jgi:hypothetical protein
VVQWSPPRKGESDGGGGGFGDWTRTRGPGASVGCVRSLVRGKGGEREKLDERGINFLLRWGGIGEKQ